MNLFKKLSTAENRRLAAFLESVACPPDTMNLLEVKGFLFAVCCAPVLSKPSEWIPEIFNHRPPNFATSEEEEFINTALVRLYNTQMADVNDGVPAMPGACKYKEPCNGNFEKGSPLHEWSRGFNEAHHLYFDHWEAGVSEDDELMAAVGFMVLTLGFFDDRDESRQMLDMAFDVDLPLQEMAPVVRAQMPQVMKEYARIGRALYEEILEEEHVTSTAGKGSAPVSNVVPFRVPHKPEDASDRLLKAEELAVQALEETSLEKRVALARKALSMSDDCARALSLLAEDAADNLQESANYYFRAMEAVKRTMGEADFADAEGHFWGLMETRPYMHAKMGYADTLWALDRRVEAINEYEDMLRLNPQDNQGARYVLLIRYLDVGDLPKAKALLDQFPEDSTWWLYSEALYWWMAKGDSSAGRKVRDEAIRSNPNVLAYFTGKRRMPKALPEFYAWGSTEEAVLYAHEARMTWRAKPGAVEWLSAGIGAARVGKSTAKPAKPKRSHEQKNADITRKLFGNPEKAKAILAALADVKEAEATAEKPVVSSRAAKPKAAGKPTAVSSSKASPAAKTGAVKAKDSPSKVKPGRQTGGKTPAKTVGKPATAAKAKSSAGKSDAGKGATRAKPTTKTSAKPVSKPATKPATKPSRKAVKAKKDSDRPGATPRGRSSKKSP